MSAEVRSHPGGYRYVVGSSWSSLGVAAMGGHALQRTELPQPVLLREALGAIAAHLETEGRSVDTLCGLELRQPAPLDAEAFDRQNARYLEELDRVGLLVDGRSTLSRTNVVPLDSPPDELSVAAFTQVVDEPSSTGTDYVITGIADVDGPRVPDDVVAPGRRDDEALAEKSGVIASALAARLVALGVDWQPTDETVVYAASSDVPPHGAEALNRYWEGADQMLRWLPSYPPIDQLELEIDARRCAGTAGPGASR